jgi:6-pyruvoyltetrahydropterin/6-carboxytetrahydropterin synthase
MTAYFGRRYKLSASHRLFCAEWDEARNLEAFGKCANPHGHGHNYVVEVLTGGAVDTVTGMVVDLVELDAYVAREVLEPFDHANLNLHAAFERKVPTSENFCIEIFDRLEKALPSGLLRQVRVEETSNNSFTYTGDFAEPGGAVRKRL